MYQRGIHINFRQILNMKKIFILIAFTLLLITNRSNAQLAQKGTSAIQLGYGYPSVLQFAGQIIKFGYATSEDETASSDFSYKGFGPLHFRYEYMLGGRVGLGLSSNYEKGSFKFVNSYTDYDENFVTSTSQFDLSSINALVRCNFHFLKNNEKLDIYYGFGVGYSHTRVKLQEKIEGGYVDPINAKIDAEYNKEFNDYLNSMFKIFPVALEDVFGLKAAFNPNMGMYFEFGYSKAICQLGFYAKLGNSKGFNRDNWKWY